MTTQKHKNKGIFLKISFIIIIYFLNVISTQQQSCATIEDISEEICASFTELSDCLIELKITIGGNEFFSEEVTLLQLSNSSSLTICGETSYNKNNEEKECEFCFDWEETAIQQEGSEEGCLSLSSSCLSDPLYLGCFNDQSLSLCHHECLNNCTGKGECQTSGLCDCFPSYRGDDCSSQCESGEEGRERMGEGEIKITIKEGERYEGYIEIDPQLAFLGIIGSIKEENKKIDVYIEKSCFPDPNHGFYDDYFEASKDLMGVSEVVKDCNQMDGGVWFVLAICSSDYPFDTCSFSLSVLQEKVINLEDGKTFSTTEIKSPENYFSFTVFSIFTVELLSSSPSLQLLLLPSQCPLSSLFLFSSSNPFYFDVSLPSSPYNNNNNNNGEDYYIYKYIISSPSAKQGVYFLRVRDTSFTYSSQYSIDYNNNNINNNIDNNIDNNLNNEININNNNGNNKIKKRGSGGYKSNGYNITISYAVCGSICEFGLCSSHDQCKCFDGFTGYKCDQPIINNPPLPPPINPSFSVSSFSSNDDQNNNNNNDDHSSNNDNNNNEGGEEEWKGILIGLIVLFGGFLVVLFLVCCFVCCVFIVKKRKNAKKLSPDNLYNLLTSPDLDD